MIFADVGAHEGQTVEAVIDRGFEVIHAFEPHPDQYATLQARYGDDPRVQLWNCGLANGTRITALYGTNTNMGASIYPDKRDVEADVVTSCALIDAGEWFADHVAEPAFVKLNCEGAEVEILDSLIDGGQLDKIAALLIDFDVRKIPGMEHHEARLIERLASVGFDRYRLADEAMVGATHAERTAHWLTLVGW